MLIWNDIYSKGQHVGILGDSCGKPTDRKVLSNSRKSQDLKNQGSCSNSGELKVVLPQNWKNCRKIPYIKNIFISLL